MKLAKEMSLAECMDIWMKSEHDYVKESSYALYSTIIEKHLKIYFKRRRISTITSKDFQSFILDKLNSGKLHGEGGLSHKTVRDMVTVLKSVLNFAMRKKLIKKREFEYKFPKKTFKKVEIFDSEETVKILKYIRNNMDSRALGILICLCTGLRIGEICALKWADVDFEAGIISINSTLQRIYISTAKKTKIVISAPKTERSRRKIPIAEELASILKKFKMENDFYVISGMKKYVEPRTYRKYYKKILVSLNISRLKFHSLRHTFATRAIENGIDYKTVSEFLGHSAISITLNLYVHPNMNHKKKCMDIIFEKITHF